MQVREGMNYHVYTAAPTTTVKELLSIFANKGISGVPVVDFKGRLLGIVTDQDLIEFLSPEEKVYLSYYFSYIHDTESIEEVVWKKMNTPIIGMMMKKNIKTLSPGDDFDRAIKLLSKYHLNMLPVVNEERIVVGIISREDIILHLTKKSLEKEISTIL